MDTGQLMISATCRNTDCTQADILYNCEGDHDRIVCGTCDKDCELTDSRPDSSDIVEFPNTP